MAKPDNALFRAVEKVFEEAEKEQAKVTINIKWPCARKSKQKVKDHGDNKR